MASRRYVYHSKFLITFITLLDAKLARVLEVSLGIDEYVAYPYLRSLYTLCILTSEHRRFCQKVLLSFLQLCSCRRVLGSFLLQLDRPVLSWSVLFGLMHSVCYRGLCSLYAIESYISVLIALSSELLGTRFLFVVVSRLRDHHNIYTGMQPKSKGSHFG